MPTPASLAGRPADALHLTIVEVVGLPVHDERQPGVARPRSAEEDSMAVVEMLTVEEAMARRAHVLDAVGGDEADLRARADLYLLSAEELAALTELEELDFLLASDQG